MKILSFILVSLLAIPALASDERRCDLRNAMRGRAFCSGYALFEFAPSSGAGLSAACACTSVTGAKGEALTFTRASNAWCTKGNETSGIANGDLVECTNNQPRIMPGGDGTGAKGLNIWEQRTNLALRSAEFDSALVWRTSGTIVAAPTVTANFATGPDGTTSAERIQFSAVDGTHTQASIVFQDIGAGTPIIASFYIKGNGTSGDIDIAVYDGAAYQCVTCSYVSSTWTRCATSSVVQSGLFPTFMFGHAAAAGYCNSGSRSAADILLWGGQYEVGAFISPLITTAGTTATRVVEVASVPAPAAITNTEGCMGGSVTYAQAGGGVNIFAYSTGAAGGQLVFTSNTGVAGYDGTSLPISAITDVRARTSRVAYGWRTSDTSLKTYGEVTTIGTYDGTLPTTGTVYLGSESGGGGQLRGTLKLVKFETTRDGCQ